MASISVSQRQHMQDGLPGLPMHFLHGDSAPPPLHTMGHDNYDYQSFAPGYSMNGFNNFQTLDSYGEPQYRDLQYAPSSFSGWDATAPSYRSISAMNPSPLVPSPSGTPPPSLSPHPYPESQYHHNDAWSDYSEVDAFVGTATTLPSPHKQFLPERHSFRSSSASPLHTPSSTASMHSKPMWSRSPSSSAAPREESIVQENYRLVTCFKDRKNRSNQAPTAYSLLEGTVNGPNNALLCKESSVGMKDSYSPTSVAVSPSHQVPTVSISPCRYGAACHRVDCRFGHPSNRVCSPTAASEDTSSPKRTATPPKSSSASNSPKLQPQSDHVRGKGAAAHVHRPVHSSGKPPAVPHVRAAVVSSLVNTHAKSGSRTTTPNHASHSKRALEVHA